ncbi:MAG: hypothetical protein ACERK1_00025 [Anaerolineales bacterium]
MFKKTLLLTALILSTSAFAPLVASADSINTQIAPLEGIFIGNVHSNNGTTAPLMLQLSQTGNQVYAIADISEGLTVDAGFCGVVPIPAGSFNASALSDPRRPNMLVADVTFDVNGFEISASLISELSDSGDQLDAEVSIDLPWLCGRDPTLRGSLELVEYDGNPASLQQLLSRLNLDNRSSIQKEITPWS